MTAPALPPVGTEDAADTLFASMPPEITNLTRQILTLWRQFYWLPEWLVIAIVLTVFVGAGWLVHASPSPSCAGREEQGHVLARRGRAGAGQAARLVIIVAVGIWRSPSRRWIPGRRSRSARPAVA